MGLRAKYVIPRRQLGLMKSNFFTIVKFIAAVLTLIAIALQPYIPAKRLLIHPRAESSAAIYGPSDASGFAVAWIDESKFEWRCDYRIQYASDICGFSVVWNGIDIFSSAAEVSGPQLPQCSGAAFDEDGDGWGWENEQSCIVRKSSPSQGRAPVQAQASSMAADGGGTPKRVIRQELDLSGYEGIRVKIHYEGRAKFLRVYMRNYSPDYPDHEDDYGGKFMSAFVRTEDLKADDAFISLSEFSVAQWWILGRNVPRELASSEFNGVVSIGVDQIEYGLHKTRVERIELEGEWVSMKNYLLGILFIWVALLLVEGCFRYYMLFKVSRLRAEQIDLLRNQTQCLQMEKTELKTKSITDVLTGIYNRAGLTQHANMYYANRDLIQFGVLLLDIDHFKKINDTHGHDVGDRILKTFAHVIDENIRPDDVFVRWGGEEFVLLSQHSNQAKLMQEAERLRQLAEIHSFESVSKLQVTVSIGVAIVHKSDDFDATLKRADIALYKAKKMRNCVIFQE